MSAPKTNLKKQSRRHAGPLIGMAVVAIAGVGLITWLYMSYAFEAEAPEGAETQVESGVGTEPADTDPADPAD
jgi:hypothetical protein